MKRHRNYTAKKYRLAKRILFFAVVALIIFILTVLLGNHLKDKLENAKTNELPEIDTTAPEEEKNDDVAVESVPHDSALSSVSAGYLDISGVTDAEGARAAVEKIKGEGFNAVSFLATDENGALTYASPAVELASRLPASESIISFEVLSQAVSAAKNAGLRLSAVLERSDSLSDEMIAAELDNIGFDEIIIRGFEGYTEFDNELVSEVNGYVDRLRKASDDIIFGLSFDGEFYKAPRNAPYIEKIYANAEFMAVDLTGLSADEITALCREITGSFSAYLLRPLIRGDDGEAVSLVNSALSEAAIEARQYVSAPQKDDGTSDGDTTDGN